MKNTLKKWIVAFALATPMALAGASGDHHYEKVDIGKPSRPATRRANLYQLLPVLPFGK